MYKVFTFLLPVNSNFSPTVLWLERSAEGSQIQIYDWCLKAYKQCKFFSLPHLHVLWYIQHWKIHWRGGGSSTRICNMQICIQVLGDLTVTTCFSFVMSEIPTPYHQYTVQGKFQHCRQLTLNHLLNINSKELFPSPSKLQSTCIILANVGQYFYKVPFEKFVFGILFVV